MDDRSRETAVDVVRRCREAGIELDPVLAAYHCAALRYQGVPWDDAFTQTAAERIVAPRSRLAVDTMAMQVAADEIRATMTAAIAADRRDREERAAAYEREVLTVAASFPRMTQREQADFMEHMWKNVFFRYVCVKGGMESALGINDEVGREETFAAFKSVFPKHETTRFLTQTAPEISAQLRELASIVLGIRVFNRRLEELSRGGNEPSPSGAVPDPAPGYLNLGAKMREDLAGRAHSAARLCAQYRCVSSHQALRRDPGDELLARLADENNNRVAYWSIIRALIEDNAEGIERVDELARRVHDGCEEVRALIEDAGEGLGEGLGDGDAISRGGVRRDALYPILESVGADHSALLDEAAAQEVIHAVSARMTDFSKPFETSLTNELLHEGIRVEKMAKERYGPHAVVGVPKIDESKDVPKTVVEPHLSRKLSETGAEITHGGVTTLEYGGYDVFALCKRRGLALPASMTAPDTAVVFQGKTYGFADEYGAKQFASQPEKYVRAMHATLFRMPELVRITHPSGEATARAFPNLDVAKLAAGMSVASPTEFGTQTDTHPVERHVDKDYEWNEWALRRRALHAANLLRKATHGSQTHSSHFRRENTTQVWLPKRNETQTVVTKGTTMPQKKRYIGGMRGAPDVKLNVVNVELDLGQPYEH